MCTLPVPVTSSGVHGIFLSSHFGSSAILQYNLACITCQKEGKYAENETWKFLIYWSCYLHKVCLSEIRRKEYGGMKEL